MNKKVKIILLISIALNLLFVSFHLGRVLGIVKPPRPHFREMMKQREHELISTLPSEKQELAEQTFKNLRKLRRDNFAEMKKQIEIIEEVTTQRKFSKEQFLNEMTKLNYTSNTMREKSNLEIAELLSKLTRKERTELAEKVKQQMWFLKKGNRPHKPE